uniref:Putative ovule protein n=1 Tax=Solanum chacoense TaxID=4108 RepID=A0A0V0H2Z4_SOLCH
MLLILLCWFAVLWKKLVFLSPCLSHKALDLCLHAISSCLAMSSNSIVKANLEAISLSSRALCSCISSRSANCFNTLAFCVFRFPWMVFLHSFNFPFSAFNFAIRT